MGAKRRKAAKRLCQGEVKVNVSQAADVDQGGSAEGIYCDVEVGDGNAWLGAGGCPCGGG